VFAALTGGDVGAVLACCEDDLDSVLVKERFVLLLLLVCTLELTGGMGPSLSFVRFFFNRDPKPGMEAVSYVDLGRNELVSRRTTGFLARLVRRIGAGRGMML